MKSVRTECLVYLKKLRHYYRELSFDPLMKELDALLDRADKVRAEEKARNRKQRLKKGCKWTAQEAAQDEKTHTP